MWFPRIAAGLAALLVAGTAVAAEPVKGAAPTDPALVEKIRKSNAECIGCHTEAALKNPPRPDMNLAKLKDALMDPALFDKSNHAGMECKVCHGQAYAAYPHDQDARRLISTCSECHAQKSLRIEMQFDASVHAKNLKDKFTCQTCHDPHIYKVAQKLGDPHQIVAQDNAMCLDCHNSDLRFAEFGITLAPKKARPDIDQIHAWLPNTKLHWSAVRCIECHTPESPTRSLAVSHEIVAKDKAEKNCVACHSQKTALRTRLYRHLAETEAADYGFVNSAVMGSAYVIGATRNTYVDLAALWLVGLTAAGIAGHGAIRLLLALIRRRRSS
jgi:hypothetical protein